MPSLVRVAVDAPGGAGPRTWTYAVPASLAGLEAGEAVLVPFGKGGRQALGIVLGAAEAASAGVAPEIRPIGARIRSDGPLLPQLALTTAEAIATHYLAPVAAVVRAMLPPGLLEHLELVAELTPAGEARLGADDGGGLAAADAALLDDLGGKPRAVRDLGTPEGRAALLRRLRSLAEDGLVDLEWTLLGASAGPRYERRAWLTAEGVAAAAALASGAKLGGPALGPRQRSVLTELAASADAAPDAGPGADGVATAALAERHGAASLAGLARRGLVHTEARERPRRPLDARPASTRGARPAGSALTPDQESALALILTTIVARDARPLLLDGVTAGGKTAIYVEAIAASLAAGRPALLLVPEIALSVPITDRLRADLGARIAVSHSGLGEGERADEWRRIRAGAVDVVVGTRTALLAPLADIGLIIVDEEHDAAYKSDRTPRFQARDAAVALAARAGAAIVLGSATPAVDSMGRAIAGEWRRAILPVRASGQEPVVQAVDMRAELAAGNRDVLSGPLAEALAALDTEHGDRAILLINRRGSASVVMCRDCGHVQACPDCERPLVFHQAGGSLRCHHCGRAWPAAVRCPQCQSPRIRFLGGGTERVEQEVRARFPALRVGRLDRDIAERKGAAERVLDAFATGGIDVLVGTSLVAKGLDVPEVTLVGVVSADVALNLPDERAVERTYQLLAQAVGRAGRGSRQGQAFIQTYQPENRAIRAVVERDAAGFYAEELALRKRFGSPPFGRLIKLTVGLPERDKAEHEATAMAERLRARARIDAPGVMVAGPVPAFIARRAEKWRYHVILRGLNPVALLQPEPGQPWSIDVDPESLL